MKSTKLWIADSDVSYVEAFREYVNLKKSHLFQVRMCTDKEQLMRIFSEEEIEVMLLTAEWYPVCKDLVHSECVILLSEGSLPREFSKQRAVYKYQSVENILREILFYYSEIETEEEIFTGVHRDNSVIGVYSPADGIYKSMFALGLGQVLSENRNVLYLNLEECSGLLEILEGSHWNLSDLVYFLRQKNKTPFLYRLNSMVQKFDKLDYVPPCESYTDFQEITVEEWQKLLYLIRTQSSYDFVILDFGHQTGHEPELLRQCDGIYMPTQGDIISQGKINQWERYIQILDGMDILERLQKLELPAFEIRLESEEDLMLLPQQELGSYIRGLLREE